MLRVKKKKEPNGWQGAARVTVIALVFVLLRVAGAWPWASGRVSVRVRARGMQQNRRCVWAGVSG